MSPHDLVPLIEFENITVLTHAHMTKLFEASVEIKQKDGYYYALRS
jgi:hypothetical protein